MPASARRRLTHDDDDAAIGVDHYQNLAFTVPWSAGRGARRATIAAIISVPGPASRWRQRVIARLGDDGGFWRASSGARLGEVEVLLSDRDDLEIVSPPPM